jgi:hypothetical protein
MAEVLQSHLSHPVLTFYRAHHWGQSWLDSLTTILDSSALLIVGGEGILAAQANISYRMGVRLLKDLTAALSITVDGVRRARLTEADLPGLRAALDGSVLTPRLGAETSHELLRLVRSYDAHLLALSSWLVIPLPSWITVIDSDRDAESLEES